MCGITGIYGKKIRNREKTISKMTEMIKHRGPNAIGFFNDNNLSLGHARLSIIDLSESANQPFADPTGRYILIYNGEIYNFKSIKKELLNLGYRFKTKSDTEVLLFSFIEWGEKCLDKINGMFAFAIWDKKKRGLFLARDKYGIKPLYYYKRGGNFYFSSEIKSFLVIDDFFPQINKSALREYLVLQNYLSDQTLLNGVKILPPGHYLKIDKKFILKQYWEFEFNPKYSIDEKKWSKLFLHEIKKSIKNQLISDVPVGSYLSGGLDSSLISSLAASNINNFPTFTCGFKNGEDERNLAKLTSEKFKTDHHELLVDAQDINILKQYIWHLEDPRMSFGFQNFLIAKFAAKYVKVILSGNGGDELFAGYPWRHKVAFESNNFKDFENKYYDVWQRIFKESELNDILTTNYHGKANENKKKFNNILKKTRLKNIKSITEKMLAQEFYFELKIFLHGFLILEDKLSMAHSLENRVPMLDDNVVNLALSIPPLLKINKNKIAEGTSGKKIIRIAAKNILPKQIIDAKKQGFVPPFDWLNPQKSNIIKNYLHNLKKRDIFNPGIIDVLINGKSSDIQNFEKKIWSLISLEQWCQLFIDKSYKN